MGICEKGKNKTNYDSEHKKISKSTQQKQLE